jgi:hypothetical protein
MKSVKICLGVVLVSLVGVHCDWPSPGFEPEEEELCEVSQCTHCQVRSGILKCYRANDMVDEYCKWPIYPRGITKKVCATDDETYE